MSEHSLEDNMELDSDMRDIISNCKEILSNTQLDIDVHLFDDLYNEKIYIKMFKKMFPFMQDKISLIENSSQSSSEKLQQLIDGLSSDVLLMDLTHIKGQAITEKDPRHLINFLQIILELSKLYVMKNDKGQEGEAPYSDEGQYPPQQQNQQNHQVNFSTKNRSSGNQDHQDEEGEENGHDGDEQEEGIYYEEEDPEGHAGHHVNQGNDFTFKNQEGNQMRLSNKKNQQNLIQKDKRAIEQGLYAHPQPRVLTTAPHLNGQGQYQDNGEQQEEDNQEEMDQEEQFIQETLSEEQRIDTEKIQELFNLFKAGILGEEDPRLGELHFLLQKYGLTLEDILKQEFLNQANPQNEENPEDSTLAQVIKVSQSRLEKMKNPKNASVSQTDNIIFEKQKKYQKFLKEYKRDYERKMRNKAENNQGRQERADYKRQRFIEHEDKMLRREYEDEQKSLYYQMRDKKVQYLRNIHKIIFELEKMKIINEQKEYNENKKTMEEEAKNKLISIENKYKNRIQMLKEGLEQKRKERHIAEIAQKQELSRQERELKERKRRQIEDLKDLWKAERDKFDMITKDDRKLENEILELYKKY